jgi:hypothetical protein
MFVNYIQGTDMLLYWERKRVNKRELKKSEREKKRCCSQSDPSPSPPQNNSRPKENSNRELRICYYLIAFK